MEKTIYSKIKLMVISVLVAFMTACSAYEEPLAENASALPTSDLKELPKSRSIANDDEQAKKEAIKKFAIILSKATYDHQEVRALLKEEASAYFDMNSDILYGILKLKKAGNRDFRDILLDYTSENELEQIESSVKMLNILVPRIDLFNINPENLDCNDSEIPVAINVENGMALYINGNLEEVIPNGSLPDFHTFVVNENSRVEDIKEPSRGPEGVIFKSPNYDGKNQNIIATSEYDPYAAGVRAVQAYSYFHGLENDNYSMALQRDFIYYGMTPESERGSFNNAISEYLVDFQVNPKSFFNISDQVEGGLFADPIISDYVVTHHKKHTEEELIKEMWSRGAYNFKFEIISTNSSMPTIVYIPLYPHELWDFNIETSVRRGNLFRRRKYTYEIDPEKFKSKRVQLSSEKISLGKWDLSREGAERYIRIFEEDKSQTVKETIEFEVTKMNSSKISGSVKFGLGTDFVSGNVGTDSSSSNTTKETKRLEITRQEEDDLLGSAKIYFYDPIIVGRVGYSNFDLHEYHAGTVTFSLTADYMN